MTSSGPAFVKGPRNERNWTRSRGERAAPIEGGTTMALDAKDKEEAKPKQISINVSR